MKNITIIYTLIVVMVLSIVGGGLLVNCCSATDEEEPTTTTETVTTTEPTEPTATETVTTETTTETTAAQPTTHKDIILHDTDLQVIDYIRLIDKSVKHKWYAYYIHSDGDLYVVTIKNNHVDVCCILN